MLRSQLTITMHSSYTAELETVVQSGLQAYNIAHVPALQTLPHGGAAAFAYDAQGNVVGGVYGEYDWGWLMVDTVWVADDVRGQGIGRACLLALEAHVYSLGVPSVYLVTADFQARPFYEKLGYHVFGVNQNRPVGHELYFLAKSFKPATGGLPASSLPDGYGIVVQDAVDEQSLAIIDNGLRQHAARTAPIDMYWLGVSLRDGDGQIIGGCYGHVFWDVFELRLLWVPEAYRKHGWGKQLLQTQEQLARDYGAKAMTLDTTDYQAKPFYEKAGYQVFGTLPDRPPNHTSYFMHKVL